MDEPNDPRFDPALLAARMREESATNGAHDSPERIAVRLARAVARWNDPDDPLYEEARSRLVEEDGVSEPMADLALRWLAEDATEAACLRLAEAIARPPPSPGPPPRPVRPRLALVSLAASVPTAPLRALAEPLLAGIPTLARTPRRGAALASLLEHTWNGHEEAPAPALRVVSWPRDDAACWHRVLRQVEVVSAYGSDATMASIASRLPHDVRWLPHGHGLSVSVVDLDTVGTARHSDTARSVALDVAAFDQLGCLSPHAVLVRCMERDAARAFGMRLFEEGLAPLATSLPRASLDTEAGAAQLAWRTVAAVRGDLWEGDGFAVSFEGEEAPRIGPGYRNVQVLHVPAEGGAAGLLHRLHGWLPHLKCVGFCGASDQAVALLDAFCAAGAPISLVPSGRMQRPAFDAPMDGRAPSEGWLRWSSRAI